MDASIYVGSRLQPLSATDSERIADIRSRRNNLIAVNRLPLELLTRILLEEVQLANRSCYISNSFNLRESPDDGQQSSTGVRTSGRL